jgi:hypothetical protein
LKTVNIFTDVEGRLSPSKLRDPGFLRVVRILSWAVNLIFLVALIGAIYQAVVNGNPLPVWAWLGLVTLFAVAIGLVVVVIVYRGVAAQVGPFDFRPSSRVAGELKSETRRVEGGGANTLRAEIKMRAGVLQLMGGATDVLDASFIYDDADWKPPVVEYSVDAAGRGDLAVEQRATHRPAMRQGRCEWVIRLNSEIPTELNVKFGAGKADLRLAGLTLDQLRVESGVGELALDLSGEWERSLQAFIKTGIGDTVLRLPENAGVRVQSTVGLGSVRPRGLTWKGGAYTNALYGQAAVTLDITVEGGMGKLKLEQAKAEESG